MKKALFIALAVAGFSQVSMAQEGAKMTPAPTQAEVDREAAAKAASKKEVAAKQEHSTPTSATSSAKDSEYKKIGLSEQQIAAINKANSHYDAKMAAINNDSKLTAAEKNSQLAAVEAEKNASLQKRLGEENYKKYTQVQAVPASAPAKKVAKPGTKPAN